MVIAFYSWVYFKIKGDNICEAKIIRNILTELLSLIYYKLLRKYKAYLDIAKFMSVIKKLVKNLWLLRKGFYICIRNWRNGRVVECTGLENQRGSHLRGFESLFFRKRNPKRKFRVLFFLKLQKFNFETERKFKTRKRQFSIGFMFAKDHLTGIFNPNDEKLFTFKNSK